MTDSMKFGPEWLRNMSADSQNSNVGNNFISNNNSNVATTYQSNLNVGNNSHNSLAATSAVSVTVASTPRNLFPEFRYGREEMLSLFEKNCSLPEILPSFKKIFIEKVQFPLALTPTTDEEILPQVTSGPTQRPWLQRSPPICFSSSLRGTGRGSSVDRGRMRGKSIYHLSYQRPNSMFEEDMRATSIKTERGWSERNGSVDSLGGVGGSTSGTVSIGSDWNGTPTSSPRKEFSRDTRNLENWRRSRNEDATNDVSNSSLSGSGEGWRGSTSTSNTFGTSRWGRSTSWRDDDISPVNTDGNGGGYSGTTMQRSYSTITTTNDRGNYLNNSVTKNPNSTSFSSDNGGGGGGSPSNRSLCLMSSNMNLTTATTTRNQWASTNYTDHNRGTSTGITDGEDNLPEWATENLSDSGGTFDASGAFHGSVDEEDAATASLTNSNKDQQQQLSSSSAVASSTCLKNASLSSDSSVNRNESEKLGNEKQIPLNEGENTKSELGKSASSSSPLATEYVPNEILASKDDTAPNDPKSPPPHLEPKQKEKDKSTPSSLKASDMNSSPNNDYVCTTPSPVPVANSNYFSSDKNSGMPLAPTNPDFSDHMKEVADDMVEKLIMDDVNDESVKIREENKRVVTVVDTKSASSINTTNSTATVLSRGMAQNSFVTPTVAAVPKSTLQHPTATGAVSISPSLSTLTGAHKTGPSLYGGNGVGIGVEPQHASLHQHHHLQQIPSNTPPHNLSPQVMAGAQQQPQPSSSSSTSAAVSTDLWYYRDPQSKVQGPFTAMEMTEWYNAGYFNQNLYVRRICDTRFRALGELIKICNGNMPFTNSNLIPIAYDNVHHLANAKVQMLNEYAGGGIKPPQPQSPQQQPQPPQQREDLRNNPSNAEPQMTTDALTVSASTTNSTVDMTTHLLSGQFQFIQEQYRSQDLLILNELAKNECFQRLSPTDKELVVRQKLQMLAALPEYIQDLARLNSMATGNPLYSALEPDCLKKELHLFNSGGNGVGGSRGNAGVASTGSGVGTGGVIQPPTTSVVNTFLDADNIIQQQMQQPQFPGSHYNPILSGLTGVDQMNSAGSKLSRSGGENELLLNDFNLHMFLRGGSRSASNVNNTNAASSDVQVTQKPKPPEFIVNTTSTDLMAEPAGLFTPGMASQNPIIQMWIPPPSTSTVNSGNNNGLSQSSAAVAAALMASSHTQQSASTQLPQSSQSQTQNQSQTPPQWSSNMLVGMQMAVIPQQQQPTNNSAHHVADSNLTQMHLPSKSGPLSMWDAAVPNMKQQNNQNRDQIEIVSDITSYGHQKAGNLIVTPASEQNHHQQSYKEYKDSLDFVANATQESQQKQQSQTLEKPMPRNQQQQQQSINNKSVGGFTSKTPNSKIFSSGTVIASTTSVKQRKNDEVIDKTSSNKRPKPMSSSATAGAKSADNSGQNKKTSEDERRRGGGAPTSEGAIAAEEKRSRSQKEEKKRQQAGEEEKQRRSQHQHQPQTPADEREERETKERIHVTVGMTQVPRRNKVVSLTNPLNSVIANGKNSPIATSSTPSLPGGGAAAKQSRDGQRVPPSSSIAPWSIQTAAAAANKSGPPCLAEIQKAERRERRADQQRQMEMLEKQMRAAAAAEANESQMLKWNASPIPVKSLAEIQAEEAANEQLELQRRKEQDLLTTAANCAAAAATAGGGGVGSGSVSNAAGSNASNHHLLQMGSSNSGSSGSNNISTIWSGNKIWGSNNSTSGFWDEPIKFSVALISSSSNLNASPTAAAIVATNNSNGKQQIQYHNLQPKLQNSALTETVNPQSCVNSNRNLKKSQTVSVMQNSMVIAKSSKGQGGPGQSNANSNWKQGNIKSQNTQVHQSKGEGDKKINSKQQQNAVNAISNNKTNVVANKKDDYENEFVTWCTRSLNNMNTKVDVPTFVSFLQDLESPYEVKDYIRMYLGENKEYTEFAKQFLERRSKYRNLQRAQNAHNDDMCKPAPAITPLGNDNSDNKSKQKKLKKNKMTKLDARILGFSVTAAEGRINVGDRDYGDGT